MYKIPGKYYLMLIVLAGSLAACSQDSKNEAKVQQEAEPTAQSNTTSEESAAVETVTAHPDQALMFYGDTQQE